MSKQCPKCRTTLTDTEQSCPCGYCFGGKQPEKGSDAGNGGIARRRLTRNQLISIVCAAAILIVAAAGIWIYTATRTQEDAEGYGRVLNKYFSAVANINVDAYVQCLPPTFYAKMEENFSAEVTNASDYGYTSFKDLFKDNISNEVAKYQKYYGNAISISYTVRQKYEYLGDDLIGVTGITENLYDSYNVGNVERAIRLDLDLTVKGSTATGKDEKTVMVVKTDGKWYVLGMFFSGTF